MSCKAHRACVYPGFKKLPLSILFCEDLTIHHFFKWEGCVMGLKYDFIQQMLTKITYIVVFPIVLQPGWGFFEVWSENISLKYKTLIHGSWSYSQRLVITILVLWESLQASNWLQWVKIQQVCNLEFVYVSNLWTRPRMKFAENIFLIVPYKSSAH